MAKRCAPTEDLSAKRKKADINFDAYLKYLYNFEKDDTTSTETLVRKAQQLEVPKDGDKWNSKYILPPPKEAHQLKVPNDEVKWNPKYNLPRPKDVQEFASIIYKHYRLNNYNIMNSILINSESLWKLLYRVHGSMFCSIFKDGFYGELYFNTDNHYLLLAIKGTTNLGDVIADVKNVLLIQKGGAIDSAITFGETIRQLMLKFKCKPMLIITGHSLGGYLAQIITFTITYFHKGEDGSVQTRERPSDDFGIYTMVFDSPAALEQISGLIQSDLIKPEMFLLPIVNFIADVNLLNSNSWIGPHLGQIIAVNRFKDLSKPYNWRRFRNIFSSHGIDNFQDLNIEKFDKVLNLPSPSKKSIKYDAKAIPSCTFSERNFARLQKCKFISDQVAEFANKLPKFGLSYSCIVIDDKNVTIEGFIPRVYHFLELYKNKLDCGEFDGKQIVDTVAFNLWRVGMLKDAHDLSLNEEWKRKIDQWPDGTKIGGFETHEEMRFVGCLLHNTIPRCVHYNYEEFISLDFAVQDNFLATTEGVIVLLKDENQINKQLHEKTNKVKIFYLILGSVENSDINLLQFCALDEKSQDKLKNKEVEFMGNKVCASLVFGNELLENLRVSSCYSFHVESALKDDFFYFDQEIVSENEEFKFNSATEFSLELSKENLKFVLIASDAGMGKSTALKQIAKTLQNHLLNNWIVHLNLFSIQSELDEGKGKLNSVAAAIEFARNAVLAERKEDVVLKKVFDWKVEAKEMVFLFDSLDEICPYHRDTAKNLLSLLKETGVQIILTTRPHEGRDFKDAQIFSVQPLDRWGIFQFVLQKFEMMVKQPPSDISTWLKKISGKDDDEFWSVPLILNMATDIFDPSEDFEAVSGKTQKTNIFETFINKSISSTLVNKMKYEKSLASGGYSEKRNLYNKLIQFLAICTIFHSGEVALHFQNQIEKHRDFIKRFDIAKVDDCNKVAFLHQSFAEYLVARLFVQNQQAKFVKKKFLDDNQLKCILFDTEFSETRKHICTILAMNSPKLTLPFLGCIINGEENLLLKILIQEDRYELYMALNDLIRSQLNKTMMVLHEYRKKVETPPLYYALQKAREEFVQQLLSDGAQFEAILSEKNVLHLAIEKGLYKEVINHFESLKSNINEEREHTHRTPLQIAVNRGSREMVEFLIHKGAVVNYSVYNYLRSPLSIAIERNSAEIVALLIANKADSAKALHWAAEFNRKNIFDIIYEKYTPSESKKNRLNESLFYAVRNGHLETIKHLCNFPEANPREVDKDGSTLLHFAAENNHFHCLDFIFEYQQPQSIDVRDEMGRTPLLKAMHRCYNKPINTVEWLLKKNANVNAVDNKGKSSLHLAADRADENLVEILLNAGAEINLKDDKGWTPLFYAVDAKDGKDTVKYLLENTSADANVRDNEGNTLLHIASKYCNSETVKLLLEHLPVNCENHKGETPLHLAASKSSDYIVELLLNAGAEINLKDDIGWTPLFYAAAAEYGEDTVHYLLENTSADANVRDNEGNTCLHIASKKYNNLETVKLLLEHLPVNCENHNGETPLHWAASESSDDIVELLLNAGAEINLKDDEGWTPLFNAVDAEYGKDTVKYLLENTSADANVRDNEGNTLLHIASKYCNSETVKLLLEHLPVNCENHKGETPLHWAACEGSDYIVELLLNAGADVNWKDKKGWTPLLCALTHYRSEVIVKALLKNSTDIYLRDNEGNTCLHFASKYGYVETAELLLEYLPDVNCENHKTETPLHLAASESSDYIVELLLTAGADITRKDKKGWTPLFCALTNYRSEVIVKSLLKNSADIHLTDNEGNTCLHIASEYYDLENVKLLLEHLPVNCENHKGETPLHWAASKSSIGIVELLLNAGADVNWKDKKGWTPLFCALTNYRSEVIVKSLLKNSADIHLSDNEGNTCLHIASEYYDLENVKLLLEHLPVNCENHKGETPLHWAASKSSIGIVELLLNAGADVNWKDKKGWTPLFCALTNALYREVIVKSLLKNSADVNVMDNEGNTCLHIASKYHLYDLETVKLLLEHLPVNCENHKGETPLHWAACEGRVKIVELLLEEGAKHNLAASDGETILRLANKMKELKNVCNDKCEELNIRSEISRWGYIVRDNNLSS